MSGKQTTRSDERGMVSFLVTLIMMIVITLIVLGFSQVTRRNEREALDRQLSAQAFYAAESGINVTRDTIAKYVSLNGAGGLATKTACPQDYSATIPAGGGVIAALSPNVQYTCVLVNPTPSDLQFSAGQAEDSTVVMPINSNANLQKLTVSWTEQKGGTKTTCAGAADSTFVSAPNWGADCDFGVLRLDLLQNPTTSATSATTLASNTVSLFLSPRGSHGGTTTVSFGTATTAYIVSGSGCSSGTCQAVINLPGNTANYELRATTLYEDSNTVLVSGTTASGPASFSGSQAVVDVTGQDQDELRRIQARVSLSSTGTAIPENALSSSTGICKSFTIVPTDNVSLSTIGANPSGTCP